MPKFSSKSTMKLKECHPDLEIVLREAIKIKDFTIIDAHRSKERQEEYLAKGKSKVHYPNSKHNQLPSLAVDIAPYPIDWQNRERFSHLAGIMIGVAKAMKTNGQINYDLRWGGDWNRNGETIDNRFDDLAHFELIQ